MHNIIPLSHPENAVTLINNSNGCSGVYDFSRGQESPTVRKTLVVTLMLQGGGGVGVKRYLI